MFSEIINLPNFANFQRAAVFFYKELKATQS